MRLPRLVCCRQSRLAPVCKRWRDVTRSPALLRRISVYLEAPEPVFFGDLDAQEEALGGSVLPFFPWLERFAAAHVQQLSITLGRLGDWEFEHDAAESVNSALRSALRACTQLQHLTLGCRLELGVSDADFGARCAS